MRERTHSGKLLKEHCHEDEYRRFGMVIAMIATPLCVPGLMTKPRFGVGRPSYPPKVQNVRLPILIPCARAQTGPDPVAPLPIATKGSFGAIAAFKLRPVNPNVILRVQGE